MKTIKNCALTTDMNDFNFQSAILSIAFVTWRTGFTIDRSGIAELMQPLIVEPQECYI